MGGDQPLVTARVDNDLHRPGHDREEVVAGVTLPLQVLAGRHRPANAKALEHGQRGIVQLREGLRVISHRPKLPKDAARRHAGRRPRLMASRSTDRGHRRRRRVAIHAAPALKRRPMAKPIAAAPRPMPIIRAPLFHQLPTLVKAV